MSKKTGKDKRETGPRTVALVGPYGSGKTTLLESILAITGAVQRKGAVTQKNSVGDASPEARARQMSVEVNCATTKYLDDSFTFLDCPGSIEFLQETLNVLPGVDAAVVVCEPEPAKVQMLKPYLKRLEDLAIPHFLFVNKIDKSGGALRDLLGTLQQASDTPLLLRQIPIWENGIVTGFVDLALERAFVYREHADRNDRIERRCQGAREGSAVPDAGKARRLRRASDGRIAVRYRTAARRSVRRSRPRIVGRPRRARLDRLGGTGQRRAAAAEGAAP